MMIKSSVKILHFLKKLLVLPGVFFLLSGCENDIQKIKSLSEMEMPELSGENIEIVYTDSAQLQLKLTAKVLKKYSRVARPYMEFPEGIYVEFYDDSTKSIQTIIRANHAFYFNEEKFWEAKGDVVVNNVQQKEKLNSEELFWDENDKIIYSNTYSRIETEDGISYGEKGFEANERFTKWKLKGYSGTVNVKEEENEDEK